MDILTHPHTKNQALAELDHLAQADRQRRDFITRAVAYGCCAVIVTPADQPAGYGVLDYTFYDFGFISMLYVGLAYRRQGLGRRLLGYLEDQCHTPKVFTSTNLSNRPMQALLAKAGYHLSGTLHDLDADDPELVYVKALGGEAEPAGEP